MSSKQPTPEGLRAISNGTLANAMRTFVLGLLSGLAQNGGHSHARAGEQRAQEWLARHRAQWADTPKGRPVRGARRAAIRRTERLALKRSRVPPALRARRKFEQAREARAEELYRERAQTALYAR